MQQSSFVSTSGSASTNSDDANSSSASKTESRTTGLATVVHPDGLIVMIFGNTIVLC